MTELQPRMAGIDVPSRTMDTTEPEAAIALLPPLLGEEGTMKYVDDGSRVAEVAFKLFLEGLHTTRTL